MRCGDPNNPAGPGHKHNGDPCGNTLPPGATRCFMHGGASPAAKIKAEQAMALVRLPAVEAIFKTLNVMESILDQFGQGTCLSCGYPSGDPDEVNSVVRAANVCARTAATILDRTGLGPKSTLEVKQSDGDLDLKALTSDERTRMIALLTSLKALKQEIRERLAAQPDTLITGSSRTRGTHATGQTIQ